MFVEALCIVELPPVRCRASPLALADGGVGVVPRGVRGGLGYCFIPGLNNQSEYPVTLPTIYWESHERRSLTAPQAKLPFA